MGPSPDPYERIRDDYTPPTLADMEEEGSIDLMRVLFVVGGVAMVLPLPWYPNFLEPLSPVVVLFLAALFIVFAALFEDRHLWYVAVIDVVLSFGAFVLAGYASLQATWDSALSLTVMRQVLVVLFAFALYTSGRTLKRVLRRLAAQRRERTHIHSSSPHESPVAEE